MRILFWSLFILVFAWEANAGTIAGQVTILGEQDQTAVIYLEGDFKGSFQPPLRNPEILQHDQFFRPTALPVLKGTTVEFPNDDDVFHNAFSFSPSNPFDFGPYGPGREQRVLMRQPGVVEVFCDIHEHMYAYILVMDHPYFSIAKQSGYKISGIPEGTYRIKAFLNPDTVVSQTVEVTADSKTEIDFSLGAAQ
ncbi:MAG: hypothetical protein ACE5GK_04880 [Nitrospiria bacterium]